MIILFHQNRQICFENKLLAAKSRYLDHLMPTVNSNQRKIFTAEQHFWINQMWKKNLLVSLLAFSKLSFTFKIGRFIFSDLLE
jgi:hypothetical protein